jgi:excisionase family DNA binding protein
MEIKEIRVKTDDLISVPEAARRLGKPKMTLYRWIHANKNIAYIKLGDVFVIPVSEVERLKNS